MGFTTRQMGVKQEVLEALCTSEWPVWGKAFATNKAETCPSSESSAFLKAVLISSVLWTGLLSLSPYSLALLSPPTHLILFWSVILVFKYSEKYIGNAIKWLHRLSSPSLDVTDL